MFDPTPSLLSAAEFVADYDVWDMHNNQYPSAELATVPLLIDYVRSSLGEMQISLDPGAIQMVALIVAKAMAAQSERDANGYVVRR